MQNLFSNDSITTDNTPPSSVPRPDHIPEKFWDATTGTPRVDELAKSYAELERARAGTAPEEPDASTDAPKTPEAPKAPPTPEALKADPTVAPKLQAWEAEYAKDGKLSEQSYKDIAETLGAPKEAVDRFLALQSTADPFRVQRSAAHEAAGGAEAYHTLLTQAQATLNPQEAKAFDEGLKTSKTPEQVQLLVKGLQARVEQRFGKSGLTVNRGTSSSASSGGFASQAEAVAFRSSPKFDKDPAYRAEYDRRFETTILNGGFQY